MCKGLHQQSRRLRDQIMQGQLSHGDQTLYCISSLDYTLEGSTWRANSPCLSLPPTHYYPRFSPSTRLSRRAGRCSLANHVVTTRRVCSCSSARCQSSLQYSFLPDSVLSSLALCMGIARKHFSFVRIESSFHFFDPRMINSRKRSRHGRQRSRVARN